MTLGVWLARRHPPAPDALRRRVEAALGDALTRDVREAPALLLGAGERLIAALLAGDSTARASALDLLTADALVTYAFEAASTDPATLPAAARLAMSRIGALAVVEPARVTV